MGRIINSDSSARQRTILTRSILHACQQYNADHKTQKEKLDIAAFTYHALIAIEKSIDQTVSPWERRDFWVKADKFRMEWSWAGNYANKLCDALKPLNWAQISQVIMEIQRRLNNIKPTNQDRIGEPWAGYWELHNKSKKP